MEKYDIRLIAKVQHFNDYLISMFDRIEEMALCANDERSRSAILIKMAKIGLIKDEYLRTFKPYLHSEDEDSD